MKTVIIKPIVTEKSMASTGGPAKYTFAVDAQASKTDIKLAIKDAFNVSVVSISTTKIKGKRKRVGKRRIEEVETATKKAIVVLKKGEKISFESITEEEKPKKKKEKKV